MPKPADRAQALTALEALHALHHDALRAQAGHAVKQLRAGPVTDESLAQTLGALTRELGLAAQHLQQAIAALDQRDRLQATGGK